jgi:hypothetical protein
MSRFVIPKSMNLATEPPRSIPKLLAAIFLTNASPQRLRDWLDRALKRTKNEAGGFNLIVTVVPQNEIVRQDQG